MVYSGRNLSCREWLLYISVMVLKCFQATVKGRVQGVAFRYHTRDTALELGIWGWVRNLPNGDVALFAEGTESALNELAAWLRRGPPLARVTHVDIVWKEPTNEHSTFKILY